MGATPFSIFTENFNQLRYISTLNEYLIEQANALYGNVWILQEDNSPVHTGKVAKAWKSQFVPHRINWPPNSPDLAPIENLCGVFKRRLMVRAPKTVEQLKKGIIEIWQSFDPEFIRPFCLSMEKRIKLCLKNKGGKIRY
ncbi:hypothetical protein LOD99_8901 [Oopsacas minuta]|uniref:Tc1-like transposase DDE domain-containing protein n=1 Tax=Oopsacas minuta TaxID=111878 RepID=A0AAV7JEF4_9METZ|nr:hypothetical protein LOD99_8901 [Oopsacas minuta]